MRETSRPEHPSLTISMNLSPDRQQQSQTRAAAYHGGRLQGTDLLDTNRPVIAHVSLTSHPLELT